MDKKNQHYMLSTV